MSTEPQTIVGIIDEAKFADGESDRGEWRRWDFRIRGPAGTKRYSTFDKGWPTNLQTGKTYRFTFTEKQSGEYTNRTLTTATPVDPGEFGTQPASNGEFQQPYEPTTDEAKAGLAPVVVEAGSKPEFKSPSRSYDQNQDIQRRSIERQVALKAAVEVLVNGQPAEPWSFAEILGGANTFFAWLREQPPEHPTEAAEPVSEPQGPPHGLQDREYAPGDGPSDAELHQGEPESDGGPALFPPEQASKASDDQKPRHFADIGQFRAALKDNFGLATTAQVNKALDEAGLGPLAELGNLAAHRGQ